MRKTVSGVAGALFLAATAIAQETACADFAAAGDILAARAAFNTAIAERDPGTIAAILSEDVVLVAASYSDLFLGAEAQLALWQGNFGREDRVIYSRTPDCIILSPLMPLAMEYGHWIGQQEGSPEQGSVSGSYAAKWALDEGGWRLDAETFMTEACEGALCPARD
ncbi:nuclear transport factor 2 family protein [Hyphobacterium indicum]|uniref:nuclear transport factor 2 family protein n=1 Tax=Hyphobacterium indicum TaxID=2162714 RepID=UPI000D654B6F|nr:nuclear transport factor 2 family protein [Hyphobacterium indicum]